MMVRRKGWPGEKQRHSMSRKGILTGETNKERFDRRKQILDTVLACNRNNPDSLFYKAKYEDRCVELHGLADDEGITEYDVDPQQLEWGIRVEMEHTKDPQVAKKIALDHLTEFPDYYTRLAKMEREAKKKFK
jgi:hypothetical protein